MVQAIDRWFGRIDRWIDTLIASTPRARRRHREIERVRAMVTIVDDMLATLERLRASAQEAHEAERAAMLRQGTTPPRPTAH